jgi:hypothetical protein
MQRRVAGTPRDIDLFLKGIHPTSAARRLGVERSLRAGRAANKRSSARQNASALALCPLSLSRRLHCLLYRRSRTTSLTMRTWRAKWARETATLCCGGWRRFFFVRRVPRRRSGRPELVSKGAGPSLVHVSVGPRTDKGKSVTGPAGSWRRPLAGAVCPRLR